jgi:hypothetical protein
MLLPGFGSLGSPDAFWLREASGSQTPHQCFLEATRFLASENNTKNWLRGRKRIDGFLEAIIIKNLKMYIIL